MPEKHNLLLIGGGGHCRSVIDSLRSNNRYDKIGIIEKRNDLEDTKSTLDGIPIIGFDDELELFKGYGYDEAFITVGSIGNSKIRKKLFEKISKLGYKIPNIIDETSTVSDCIQLGKGIFIGKSVIVNAGANIKNGAIINSGSIIEHDCFVGEYVHISPGSILCGNVSIGSESHIGAGSIIKQSVSVGNNTVIGMGSVVLSDFGSYKKAYGNPCKEVVNG
jgi:sugar O-acyltransferase (sialic acid O-acetyltransferase NeuD family)